MTTDFKVPLSELSAQLATEVALGLSGKDTLLERYGLTDEEWEKLKANRTFRSMVAEAVRTFKGDINAKRRIRLKASIAFEDSIPTLYAILHGKSTPFTARNDAAKLLARVAEVDRPDPEDMPVAGAGGSGFQISINIGEPNDSPRTVSISGGPRLPRRGEGQVIDDNHDITADVV